MPSRRETGEWGEALAAKHLIAHGYTVLARNWRHGRGEIDIVARQGDVFVFVEVRTRHGDARGMPEETLTPRKRAVLIATATAYMDIEATVIGAAGNEWRIDVIAVELDARNAVRRLTHIEHALEERHFPGDG
jgi:putative endonuclease